MKRLEELITNLQALEAGGFFEIIEKVVRENEAIIVEMNSEDQLYEKGIDREGVAISSYAPYSPVTIQIKKQKGQPTARVTLRDSEDFHHSFFLKFTPTGFEIAASDWKTQDLVRGYGEGILGLTYYNFEDLARSYVLPEIIKALKAA